MGYDLNDALQDGSPGKVRSILDVAKPYKANGVLNQGGWQEPEPVLVLPNKREYPLAALPSGILEAVKEVIEAAQCPPALAACSAISALSLAGQGIANVERPGNLVGPTSVFIMQIAESGERKTTVDNYFSAGIREYERERSDTLAPKLKDYEAALGSWESKRTGIKRAIEAKAKKSQGATDLEEQLRNHEALKPLPPRIPRLLHSDATPEALASELYSKWPTTGLMSSEGGVVLGSHSMQPEIIMRNLSMLNILWDGGTLSITRKNSESFTVENRRLSIGIAVQPETVRQFHEKSKGLSRGSGFTARFLTSCPESTIGKRFFRASKPMPCLAAFQSRLKAMLAGAPQPENKTGSIGFHTLKFSDAGRAEWISFYDETERRQSPGGDFEYFRDVGSKAAENAARLAALFHLFDHGPEGDISEQLARGACQIADWHISEAKRFLSTLAAPPEENNTCELDTWLRRKCLSEGTNRINAATVLRYGPPFCRKAKNRDTILEMLTGLHRARYAKHGGETFIEVNPTLLSAGP